MISIDFYFISIMVALFLGQILFYLSLPKNIRRQIINKI
jgi:hypothetical protein